MCVDDYSIFFTNNENFLLVCSIESLCLNKIELFILKEYATRQDYIAKLEEKIIVTEYIFITDQLLRDHYA